MIRRVTPITQAVTTTLTGKAVNTTYTAFLDGSTVGSKDQLSRSLRKSFVAEHRQVLVVETVVRCNALLRFANHRKHPRLSFFGSVS